MDDLVMWLRDRLDEQRGALAAARDHRSSCTHDGWDSCDEHVRTSEPLDYSDPAFGLADVDAKLRILAYRDELAKSARENGYDTDEYSLARVDELIPLLALPYADRAGYRDEWRPDLVFDA